MKKKIEYHKRSLHRKPNKTSIILNRKYAFGKQFEKHSPRLTVVPKMYVTPAHNLRSIFANISQ